MWTVNATDVEWVECEHVNKTGLMLQLETQIHDVTSQMDLATKKNQLHDTREMYAKMALLMFYPF